jgi:light-regulated signal transduction histidine kinase (bacteriophytochrome)
MDFEQEIQKSKELEAKALDECNSEPIQTPGRIQGYGAVIAFHLDSLIVSYCSLNIDAYFQEELKTILGNSVKSIFNSKEFHQIANVASHRSTYLKREHVLMTTLNNQEVDISLFRTDDYVVLEIIPITQPKSSIEITGNLKWVLDHIRSRETVREILNISVNALKKITDFDRVKVYRFHPDHSGEVVAEVNNGRMDSYLGLRFPASDIPPIARELFLKIPIRHLYDTSCEGVAMVKAAGVSTPLNLSLGILRGNSPIHNQYLKNMGVASTLTLPIIIHDKLWGLFSLHHQRKKILTSEVAYTAELIGQLASMVLEQTIEKAALKKIRELELEGKGFITLNQSPHYLKKFWSAYKEKLQELVRCDGVAYQIDQKILMHGDCPIKKGVISLSKNLDFREEEIFHFTDLSEITTENLKKTRGALILRINDQNPKIYIYFFRNDIEQEIKWAGDPKKDLVIEKNKVRLHPRSSFNHFKQLSKGKSELWDSEVLTLAEIALAIFKKAVKSEKATSNRLKIIVHELNHRLRNILTLVRSISRQTAKEVESIDHYVDSLEHRILALAQANNLLTKSSYNSVDLKALLVSVIPSLCNHPDAITYNGPDVKLGSNIIPIMVLIIHELTTNAVKYGSLSIKQGELEISWNIGREYLCIVWKELGGPMVSPPKKKGFGTTIIANAISYEFGGTSTIDFQKQGLQVTLKIPNHLIGENETSNFVAEQIQEVSTVIKLDKSKKINVLILEDDYINAEDIKSTVASFKVNQINLFSNQKEALESLEKMEYHLVFLDVNLKQETSIEVANYCEEIGVPFYYLTGYGKSFLSEGTFPNAPVLLKPIRRNQIKQIIRKYIQ